MSVFAPGVVLDERFEVAEEVGAGGMGVVYRAYDTRMDRTVALKALREQLVLDAESLRRFKREAQLVSALAHPNIMEIYSVSVTRDGIPYFAMEFLHGEQLSELLERRGKIPWRELLPMMIAVCDGLQYAHEQQIVHRDIKPSNIMLVDGNVVKVVDFGIAKSVAESAPKLTKTNMMMGSVPYMSPSEFTGGAPTAAGDVYALGCTMVELLTGKPPYVGETIFETISMHSTAPVPRLAEPIPPDLQRLIEWMLEKKPEDRAPSAVAVREALQAILDGKPSTILKRAEAVKVAKAAPRLSLGAIAAVLVLAFAGMLAWTLMHPPPAKEEPSEYLTKSEDERKYVLMVRQEPRNAKAWVELGTVYAHAFPRQIGAAKLVLDKALSLELPRKTRSNALLTKGGNEIWYGDYEQAIVDLLASEQLADPSKGLFGQKRNLMHAYTPARKFAEQIAVGQAFFNSPENVREGGSAPNKDDYSVMYCNTIEALIHEEKFDEALELVKMAAPDDNGAFSSKLLALVARQKLMDKPSPEQFEEAREGAVKGASPLDVAVIDIIIGWAMSSRPEVNDDGLPSVVRGTNALLVAPRCDDPIRTLNLYDAAMRYIDYYRNETRMYNGENMGLADVRDKIRALRDQLCEDNLKLSKPLPVEL